LFTATVNTLEASLSSFKLCLATLYSWFFDIGLASDSSQLRSNIPNLIYSKPFDNIVLCRFGDSLISSELQFGFKVKSSTHFCSMVLKESLAYYARHQRSVFCAFLDAAKAFDRIWNCKLFKLLMIFNNKIKCQLGAHIHALCRSAYFQLKQLHSITSFLSQYASNTLPNDLDKQK